MSNQQDTIYALAADDQSTVFAARHSGLYRSVDGGRTWNYAYESLDSDEQIVTPGVALSPNFANDSTVFAGLKGAVLRSFDSGDTWHVAGLHTPPPMVSALAISPDFVRDKTIFAGTVSGLFRSTNRGLARGRTAGGLRAGVKPGAIAQFRRRWHHVRRDRVAGVIAFG